MQLYIIRHAQSENNALWIETGRSVGRVSDPSLSEIGKQQASLLADYLSGGQPDLQPVNEHDPKNLRAFGLTHLYCSLMQRAILTAIPVAESLGIPLVGHPDIHEGGGIYLDDEESGEKIGLPGKSIAELRELYPKIILPETIDPDGWWNRPFETREERIPRAQKYLSELLNKHNNGYDRVALITHAAFTNYLLAAIFGQDERLPLWIEVNNASITRVDYKLMEISIVYTNRTDYLPAELIT